MVVVVAGFGAMALFGTVMVRPGVAVPYPLPLASVYCPYAGLAGLRRPESFDLWVVASVGVRTEDEMKALLLAQFVLPQAGGAQHG